MSTNIYVSGGQLSNPFYKFYSDKEGTQEIENLVIDTNETYIFERVNILRYLRLGNFDVLVGVNLFGTAGCLTAVGLLVAIGPFSHLDSQGVLRTCCSAFTKINLLRFRTDVN